MGVVLNDLIKPSAGNRISQIVLAHLEQHESPGPGCPNLSINPGQAD